MIVLILGGYGTFGGRLAQLLATDDRLALLIAGRSAQKARAFCRSLPPGATRKAISFDRDLDIEKQIQKFRPHLLVDATGPFQAYGDQPYRVVQGCIATGTNYMDLADGSEFVKGIDQFDEAARSANVYVLSGVSSYPVLTAAVVRHLSQGLSQVDSITGGIAPSPYAGVGPNVIRAIASYSGRRVALVRNGRPDFGQAMTESRRYTICPPGCVPLGSVRFSLVDVPDLRLLPELWPGLDSIWMGAGPVPEVLHRMLNGLSWLVRWGAIPSLSPLASLFHSVINVVRWGEHRGGMFVSVQGRDGNGNATERSWHLLAEGDNGPLIPSMAVEALIHRCLGNALPSPGARAATRDLELADYEALFQGRQIHTGCRESSGTTPMPLYRKMLGEAWTALPEPLRQMHDCIDQVKAEGRASVERGTGLLSRLTARLFGFPEQGTEIPVQVAFRFRSGAETWRRTFNGKSFSSVQSQGRGHWEHLVVERFGPFSFGLALVVKDHELHLIVRRWSLLGMPLPRSLAPGGLSYEHAEGGRFWFHVEIKHALTGLIVRYRGWLVPT